MKLYDYGAEKSKKVKSLIWKSKSVFLVLLSFMMILSLTSCGNDKPTDETKDKPTDETNVKNESSQQTENTMNLSGVENQSDLYELILETDKVKSEYTNSNRGYYSFFHKSGDYIFYLSLDVNSCLMSLNINTRETKQIAYVDVDVNNPIQYSSTKLVFNGSKNGYNMQLMQYDIVSQNLSEIKIENLGSWKLSGNSLISINDEKIQYVNLTTNEIEFVSMGSDTDEMSNFPLRVLVDPANEDVFYFTAYDYNENFYLYSYNVNTKSFKQSWDLNSLLNDSLITPAVFMDEFCDSEHIEIINNYLYVFTQEQGVYTVDSNGSPVQLSQYPADRYITYRPEKTYIYQDNAIYYRAATPHSDLIIKLENGKETVIKTSEIVQDTNFSGSPISGTVAIQNDDVWCVINSSDKVDIMVNGVIKPFYVYYLASFDENGNTKNSFELMGDIIAFDDGYMYCYGIINRNIIFQQLKAGIALQDTDDPIYAFVKVKIGDTKVNINN